MGYMWSPVEMGTISLCVCSQNGGFSHTHKHEKGLILSAEKQLKREFQIKIYVGRISESKLF